MSATSHQPKTSDSSAHVSAHQHATSRWARFNSLFSALHSLLLAGLAASVSCACLTPLFGSLAGAANRNSTHQLLGSFLMPYIAFGDRLHLPDPHDLASPDLLPLLAALIPVLHRSIPFLTKFLNADHGLWMAEALCVGPFVFECIMCSMHYFDLASVDPNVVPGVLAICQFFDVTRIFSQYLTTAFAWRHVFYRPWLLYLPFVLTFARGRITKLVLISAVIVAVTVVQELGTDLSIDNGKYRILDRWDSVTGYVSVVESVEDEFRVVRCDHSLLGGEWLATPARAATDGISRPEPVFPVFTMLEAVRLMHLNDDEDRAVSCESKANCRALVIGLGIGTCPGALVRHGIDTTVVELDPAVIHFAQEYFALPHNVTVLNQDALKFVGEAVPEQYDFIVHDVFTGGAVPLPLFTQEFLEEMGQLMTPNGFIAINYAGNLKQLTSTLVLRTILNAFGECAAYRDAPEAADGAEEDFVNLVIFCSKLKQQTWQFRAAEEEDFLESQTRRQALVPRHRAGLDEYLKRATVEGLMTRKRVKRHASAQGQAAARHWKLMRAVLPDAVWDRY